MLVIRLQRVGRKNDPRFRLVVTDSKNGPKSGNFVEILGSHNPLTGKPVLKVERIKYWLSVGAKTSETVHNMLINFKIIEGQKYNVLPKKKEVEKEAESPQKDEKPQEEPKEEPKEEIKEEVEVEKEEAENINK